MAGVIGYMAQMSMPDARIPSASAPLPVTTTFGSVNGIALSSCAKSRCSSAHAKPTSSRRMFRSMTAWSFLRKIRATSWRAIGSASR